jgi:hypothetical protein
VEKCRTLTRRTSSSGSRGGDLALAQLVHNTNALTLPTLGGRHPKEFANQFFDRVVARLRDDGE